MCESAELSRLVADRQDEDLLERAGEIGGDGIAIRKVISTCFGDAGIDPISAEEGNEVDDEMVDLVNVRTEGEVV